LQSPAFAFIFLGIVTRESRSVLQRIRVKARALVGRLSGLSISWTGLGFSWKPRESERDVVRELIIYLEDKRPLFDIRCEDFRERVESSWNETRSELTSALQRLDDSSKANEALRILRRAVRNLLTAAELASTQELSQLGSEIGAVKDVFRKQISLLAHKYDIEINEDLTRLLSERQKDDADREKPVPIGTGK
jgi:hypothetical protein